MVEEVDGGGQCQQGWTEKKTTTPSDFFVLEGKNFQIWVQMKTSFFVSVSVKKGQYGHYPVKHVQTHEACKGSPHLGLYVAALFGSRPSDRCGWSI